MDWKFKGHTFLAIASIFSLTAFLPTFSYEPSESPTKLNDVPLSSVLAPGQIFDKELATAFLSRNEQPNQWCKIPAWLAGTWETVDAQTIASNTPNKVKLSRQSWGYLPTKDGWWHLIGANPWKRIETQKECGHIFWASRKPVFIGSDSAKITTFVTIFSVDEQNNKIKDIVQGDLFDDYQRVSDGLITMHRSSKLFYLNGKPAHMPESTFNLKKILEPKCITNTEDGRSTEELFRAYGVQHKLPVDELCNVAQAIRAARPDLLEIKPGNQSETAAKLKRCVRWAESAPGCSTVYQDGIAYRTITADGVLVACCLSQNSRYKMVRVFVANQSNHPIDVLPDKFTLDTDTPADLNGCGKSQACAAHTLAYVTFGNYVPGEGYHPPLRATSCGNTAVIYSRPSPLGLIASMAAKNADKERQMGQHLLKANTLMPQQQLSGEIPFKKSKTPASQELKLTIADDTFLFPGM